MTGTLVYTHVFPQHPDLLLGVCNFRDLTAKTDGETWALGIPYEYVLIGDGVICQLGVAVKEQF